MRSTLGLALLVLASSSTWATSPLLEGLKWREIGPFRGGRSVAVSGVAGKPTDFYMGTTGGGVWKSTDAGQSWKNVSDGFFTSGTIGCIGVSASKPEVVYVGTGEDAIRGNMTFGDGVYKSEDAGATWKNIGLKETQTISRVVVHPTDPSTVWVAALGHIYGPHPDRGVFKSTDGGKSWKKTLFVDDRSGAGDLCIDPSDPKVLYACSWTAWRTPFSLNSGGPGSKMFKSTDGGETWKDISRNPGMPEGMLGRMRMDVSRVNPKVVWAMVEAKEGGLFKSENAGDTWTRINSSSDIRQRPWYFSKVVADTKDINTVFVGNVQAHKSTDGGKTFRAFMPRHADNHDFWIDPADSNRIAIANDGGVTVSVDGGRTWSEQDYATAQFYHVSADNALPYNLLGCQQDNSSVRIASRTIGIGITKKDWSSSAGGESGYIVAAPNDPDWVFGGNYSGTLQAYNHRTNLSRGLDPWPDDPTGGGIANVTHRFQWTFPIVFSPHNPNRMFATSQHVMVTDDMGDHWRVISPDLTRNDKSKQGPSGGELTKDNTGVETYCTIFTFAESPRKAGLYWTGSDDGLVHISRNGGRNWTNVTPKGMPDWGLCSMIEASPHAEGKAILAVDNHENDDLNPYIYITEDYGKTWRNAVEGIEANHWVRAVREDPAVPGMLYAGTESGVYVSYDNGRQWSRLALNLPTVPIHDLIIKEDDLCVATHGRSFWILDDITPLRQVAGADTSKPKLFAPRPGRPNVATGNAPEPNEPVGQNPSATGIVVSYYLPNEPKDFKLELLTAQGEVVSSTAITSGPTTIRAPKSKGFNRIGLSPRMAAAKSFEGMRMWGGTPGALRLPPGDYRVRMTVDGNTQEVPARWNKDPRTKATDADLVEQFRFSKEINARYDEANRAVEAIRILRARAQRYISATPGAEKDLAPLMADLDKVENNIYQTNAKSGQDFLNHPIKLNNKLANLLSHVQSGPFRPANTSYDVFKELSSALDIELAAFAKVRTAINEKIRR
jgi:photosystem II stability/assembly factor-like uncharacterized protein